MHYLYSLVRFFPYWALPLAFLAAEVGWHFRRKGSPIRYYCWVAVVCLLALTFCWVGFRGDLHSDRWVRYLVQGG